MSRPGRVGGLVRGALGARLAAATLRGRPPGGPDQWRRANHRGRTVTLLEGPALICGGVTALLTTPGLPPRLRAAGVVALAGAGAIGGYDDLAGSADVRGLRGHLQALARGEVTTGLVKVVGLGATGLVAAALVGDRAGGVGVHGPAGPAGPAGRTCRTGSAGDPTWPTDRLLAAAVIAAGANLLNLFDLRPGRALKVALVAGLPALAGPPTRRALLLAGPLGAAAALLPDDLGERAMLGDAGANALGALLATASVAGTSRAGLLVRLGAVGSLTLASERVSFTRVIAATPPLHWADRLGTRP